MNKTKDIEMEVMKVHNLFWESYARRDIELRFSLCSEDITFIGSGLHERALNKTEYKNINKEGVKQFPNPFQIEFLWTNLTMLNENVACVESEVVWSQLINNEMSKDLLRNTTLLKCDDNKWLVTHVHGSVPDYRLKDGDYMTNEQTIIRNRELERQVFERTRDLNKTLEELELKNRELEIEASLERVRAVAMSMNKSDDLISICEVSYKEFQKLGFNSLRNAIIHIPNDENKYFMDYDFSDLTGGAITKIEYGSHPVVEDYLKQIKSAKNAFAQTVLKEDQLEEWKDFRRNSGQIDDPRLNKATALYYYFFSIGIGDIGISTLEPINESQIKILKRFRNVFDLAYRRYTDITRAEAQAREAKIEAALERVRSRSLAMHKSDEIKDVVVTVMEKMNELKIEMNGGVSLATFIEGSQDLLHWYVNPSHVDGPVTMHLPYFDNILFHDFIKARNEGNELLPVVYSFEQKNKYFEYAFEHSDFRIIHEELKKWILEQPYFGYSVAIQKHSAIFFNDYTGKLFSEKENEVLIRFAKVFDQAYIRFLDLQKSEAQARESQIQLALERVRARTMAMQKSDELKEVVASMFDGMKNLGVDPTVCNIALVDRKTCDTDVWTAHQTDNGMITYKVFISHFEHPFRKKLLESFLNEISFSVHELSGDLKKSYAQYLFEHVDYSNVPAEVTKSNEELANMEDGIVLSAAYMKYGLLIVSRNHAISNDESDILQRFAKIFEQTYTRFLDLQKAEAQAKEAQIEVALERVRSQSMGMQSSKDFSNVTTEMFNQLRQFGGDLFATGIVFCDKHDGHVEQWHSLPDAGMLSPFIVPVNLDYIHQYRYDQWKKGVELFEIEIPGDFIEQHFNDIFNLPTAQKVLKDFEDQHTPMPETPPWEIDYGASFKHGYILVSSLQPFKEAEILPRFAKVFEQTYTRFLDLQKAEAQAREAQIEAALERVRSRTMGMQKSLELKDVIRVVYEQFVHLKINVDHAGFVVDYTPKGDWHFWIADEQDIPSKITHPYFESVWANQFNEAKEKGADFFATNLNFEEKNKFYNELLSYVPGIPEASKDFYLSCPGLAATTVLFDNVSLYIENFSGTPYSDEENKILMRFGKVFQQTYTRFLDLQKAEAQAREANIETSLERVRSKAMAMHTTGDLSATVSAAFSELRKLGVETIRTGVALYSEDKPAPVFYASTTTEKDDALTIVGSHDPSSHTCLALQFDAWSQQQNYFPVLRGEELKSYYLALSLQPFLPKDNSEPFQHDEYGYYLPFSGGNFYVWSLKSCTENEISILSRFRAIIDLTFRRYFEIQNAEAQARESQIEASLERVRSKALAMHSPNDLSETVNVFFKELKILGIIPIRCGVGQIDKATRTTNLTTTTSSQQGDSFQVIGKVKQTGHPVLDGIFDHWELQKEYHPVLEGDDIKAYYNVMNAQIGYPEYPEEVTQYGNNFFFKEGFVFAWTENLLSEEELIIFRRFTLVLSLTYRRYLDLKEAEERNKIIEAENERKSKELEEARQLQLAMLPKSIPEIANLDIAVYMKTATEVGGDYYDFKVQENGVLNIGIGDATGHGLQAGTMITLMKGFFTSDVAKFNPKKFLQHCNGMIREIKLGRILMSFSHLRFENNSLLISSAGMPPIYYHHKKNNRTEEIIIQGLPLGAMGSSSYKHVEKQLNIGDTILLLTDGLPEQMNSHKVIFDYSRVLKYFDEIAENNPNDIINRLVQKANEWMDGTAQVDDITFVVIKVK